MVNLFGFTLLRNGIKYDYSFEESLRSLSPITQEIYVAVGDSEDGTEKRIADFPKVVSIPTVWDDNLREGGVILSQQTNVALDTLREAYGHDEKSWGFYLQCDEVIHEDDYDLILQDIEKAQSEGYDAVSFRYLHFWMDHHHIAINKKWYPQEIRCVKLNSKARSWGDAQSFENCEKVYPSDARIFHYGHVREKNSYQKKKRDILKLYHSDEKLPKYRRKEERFDNQTECLVYLGKHPSVMKSRVLRLGDTWDFPPREDIYIVSRSKELLGDLENHINAKNIHWLSSPREVSKKVPKEERKRVVYLSHGCFWQRVTGRARVPCKMRSKHARIWPKDFQAVLKLSEKGISLKQNA